MALGLGACADRPWVKRPTAAIGQAGRLADPMRDQVDGSAARDKDNHPTRRTTDPSADRMIPRRRGALSGSTRSSPGDCVVGVPGVDGCDAGVGAGVHDQGRAGDRVQRQRCTNANCHARRAGARCHHLSSDARGHSRIAAPATSIPPCSGMWTKSTLGRPMSTPRRTMTRREGGTSPSDPWSLLNNPRAAAAVPPRGVSVEPRPRAHQCRDPGRRRRPGRVRWVADQRSANTLTAVKAGQSEPKREGARRVGRTPPRPPSAGFEWNRDKSD